MAKKASLSCFHCDKLLKIKCIDSCIQTRCLYQITTAYVCHNIEKPQSSNSDICVVFALNCVTLPLLSTTNQMCFNDVLHICNHKTRCEWPLRAQCKSTFFS